MKRNTYVIIVLRCQRDGKIPVYEAWVTFEQLTSSCRGNIVRWACQRETITHMHTDRSGKDGDRLFKLNIFETFFCVILASHLANREILKKQISMNQWKLVEHVIGVKGGKTRFIVSSHDYDWFSCFLLIGRQNTAFQDIDVTDYYNLLHVNLSLSYS